MVEDNFDYQKYINAMNAIACAQSELEKYTINVKAELTICQRQIEEKYKKKLDELEQLRQDAVEQFSMLSLRYCKLCNIPAKTASAIPSALPLREALAKQVNDAKDLQCSLDDILLEREAVKRQKEKSERLQQEQVQRDIDARNRAEEQRIIRELQRRQQILEDELRRAGCN